MNPRRLVLLRHHPPTQVAWFVADRLVRRLPARTLRRELGPRDRPWDEALLRAWGAHPAARLLAPSRAHSGDPRRGLYRASGVERRFVGPLPFAHPGGPPLFDEQLGSLDGMAALLATCRGPRIRTWLPDYVAQIDDALDGAALHPYPTATRLLHLLRCAALLLANGHGAEAATLRPVALRDARWLTLRLERHNRANHLLRELCALRLASAVFGHPGRWSAPLEAAVQAQFLPDGGHVELSPSYGLRCLRDLVELRAALGRDAIPLPPMARGLAHLRALDLGDGLPLLGDSERCPDPSLDAVIEAAELPEPPRAPLGRSELPDTGLQVLRDARSVLLLRAGPVPAGTVAHLHADQGALTWSLDGRTVLGALGASTYEAGPDRDRTRSAAAHCAVALPEPQMQWLGAFRVGRRSAGAFEEDREGVSARVVWPSGASLGRTVRQDGDGLRVHDRCATPGATAWFHVPDGTIEGEEIVQGDRRIRIPGARMQASRWFPRVGEGRPAVSASLPVEGERVTRVEVR